ncbi:hypothetical protein P691DRAFT_812907, partial [Macrolepiota fuliginosa MF-IS2]
CVPFGIVETWAPKSRTRPCASMSDHDNGAHCLQQALQAKEDLGKKLRGSDPSYICCYVVPLGTESEG